MNRNVFLGVIGVLVVGVGVFAFFDQANSKRAAIALQEIADSPVAVGSVIEFSHNGAQLEPSFQKIKAGTDYTIKINPSSDGVGCMSTIKLPQVDESPRPIIEGVEIAYNVNLQPGTYDFVCNGMEMKQGSLVVEA